MFERFTEKNRRAVFFARNEASQSGSPYVETEHLLLGLLREDRALTNRFLHSHASVESIRKQIEGHTTIREKISASVDPPLSNESKRVLAYAAEEAERLSHRHIGTEHLLLGLLREEKCLAAEILHERGLKLSAIREELARTAVPRPPTHGSALLSNLSRDLTEAAMNSQLNPLIGRDQEIEGVIEALCSLNNNNPVLIGERGIGKSAIVAGLAQRIADGEVPPFLAEKRILAFDLQLIVGWTRDRQKFEERLNAIVKELVDAPNAVMFIDELQGLVGTGSASSSLDAAEILKPALLRGEIQCIGTAAPSDYRKLIQTVPWIGHCFRTVNVLPLDEDKTLRALYGYKDQYEKFHAVVYTDDALMYAVRYSKRYISEGHLLANAMDLLDTAGTRVKLRQTSLPEEIREVQKRIKFIAHRMEKTIADHQFEKARFYSDEERKERDNLRTLREKYHLDESAAGVVGREEVEDVVSRRTGVSITSMREEQAVGEEGASRPDTPPAAPLGAQKNPTFRVFLCHSSKDKPAVRDLYRRLKGNNVDPWLDAENLLPGQKWDYEIGNAVRSSHVVIVCLSAHTNKAGYLQKEIKKVLDVADQQPEGTIFLIPLKLEECEVPSRLQDWQWVNLFEENGFEKLMRSLLERAREVGVGLREADSTPIPPAE